MTIIIMLLI